MKPRKPKYKLIQSREATMEDVNGATLRAIEYLIEQGVLKDETIECDNLFEKISIAIEEHYNYPDYGNYN
jgi:hypothetical protein